MASSRNQHNNSQLLGAHHTIPNPEWREFVCGWGAAFINITVTFPINKVMFRQVYLFKYNIFLFDLRSTFFLDALWYAYKKCLHPAKG